MYDPAYSSCVPTSERNAYIIVVSVKRGDDSTHSLST